MKTFCKPKQVNIENVDYNRPAVHLAFGNGKLRRHDFRQLLASTGTITEGEINRERMAHECNGILKAIDVVADEITERIRNRDLQMKPVRQFKRIDGISRKERDLCQESPEQQICEYILVYALGALFRAKILPCQYGSIPGRGQVAGARRIERLVRRKILGHADAIKCDVHHAYPSTTTECVMRLLRRDVHKNKVLLWFAEAVMNNYPGGVLIIGGYFSTWAFNYVMSYLLRFIMAQEKVRRGVRSRMTRAIVCYADDFLLIGYLSQLEKAVKRATRWAKSALGITIKGAWQIIRLPSFEEEKALKAMRDRGETKARTQSVDMMGFAVRRTYTIIRKGIFRRVRRQLLRADEDLKRRGFIPHWRAAKLTAYNGWIVHSDSRRMRETYNVDKIMAAARYSAARWQYQQNMSA